MEQKDGKLIFDFERQDAWQLPEDPLPEDQARAALDAISHGIDGLDNRLQQFAHDDPIIAHKAQRIELLHRKRRLQATQEQLRHIIQCQDETKTLVGEIQNYLNPDSPS
jgi:hypothetical protein